MLLYRVTGGGSPRSEICPWLTQQMEMFQGFSGQINLPSYSPEQYSPLEVVLNQLYDK